MAFKLGDLVVDRIIMGVAEKSDGTLLYTLTNLQEATIEISADSQDAVDGTGAVIKTFYRAKTGTFTATNSTINLPILGAMSGTDPQYASVGSAITMPRILTVAKTSGIDLPGITDNGANNNVVVYSINNNGTLGDAYASSEYTITPVTNKPSTMAITARTGDTKFIIKYNRSVTENGMKIQNRSDAFPKSVKLTLKVLIVD